MGGVQEQGAWITPEMLDAVDVGMVLIGSDGSLLRWNAEAERVLGTQSAELATRTTMDPRWNIVRPDGSPWPEDEHPVLRAIASGEAVRDVVLGFERPDDRLVWLRLNVQPTRGPDGVVDRAFAVFSDITAQVDAERAALVVEQRLRSAIERAAIGTALLNLEGRAIYVNRAYAEILEAPREVLTGMALQDLVHPEDRTIRMSDLAALQRGEIRSLTNTWRLTAPGAPTKTIRTHLSFVGDKGAERFTRAEPIYLVQLEDVTEQRQLGEALRRAGRTARAALDALEQGVVLTDGSSRVYGVNPAAERITGFSREEFIERWSEGRWELWSESGEPLPADRCPVRRSAATGEAIIGEIVRWRRADGERIAVRISSFPGDHGIEMPENETGIVVAFSDVTEQRKADRLLDATLDTAPAGLAVIEAATAQVIRCNHAFANQLGQSIDALVGSDVRDLLDVDERAEATAWARELVSDQRAARHREQRIIRPDGAEVWLEVELALVDELDRSVFVVATFDVTERLRLMADLERFSHLFEQANDIITVVDPDGGVLYTSPSTQRVLGYPRHERHPDGILGIVHPDDQHVAKEQLAALSGGDHSAGPVPFRVLTADGEWRHLECMAVNLLDEPSVGGIVLTLRDTTEREQLIAQLEHRAAHDLLTDLPNRMLVDSRLSAALARAERAGSHVGLCFVDLDNFKAVNDTLGHHAGDRVLVEVARRLAGAVRAGDTAGRIGGDEFVVVLDPVADVDDAMAVAERVRDALIDPPVLVVGGVPVGASVGVAVSRRGEDEHGLRLRADRALYRAKARVGSVIEVASVA